MIVAVQGRRSEFLNYLLCLCLSNLASGPVSVFLLTQAATFFPHALAHLTLRVSISSFSVLKPVAPHAVEYATIRPIHKQCDVNRYNCELRLFSRACQIHLPGEDTMTLFFVVNEGAFVFAAIAVHKQALAVHLVVHELARVAAAVGPRVLSTAFHFIVRKFALVTRFVKHDKLTNAMAEPIAILTFEAPIVPFFSTCSVLLVI